MKKFFLLFAAFFSFLNMAAAKTWDECTPLEKEYVCAQMSVAAYSDRIGMTVRGELIEAGWELDTYREKQKKAEPKFNHARRKQTDGSYLHIITVTGTASYKDLKNNLNVSKSYFAGTTSKEFFENASMRNVAPSEPMVHGGYDTYASTAFFTPVGEHGDILGETMRDTLLADKNARLCITGHSLGGAVAVIFAMRLISMGVPSEQIEVVNFGAPAVGNEAFVNLCREKELRLDRVVIAGDPVRGLFQSLIGGDYKQFEDSTVWRRNHNCDIFRHSMVVYFDAAMRVYYEEYEPAPPLGESDTAVVLRIKLDDEIKDDEETLRRLYHQYLTRTLNQELLFMEDEGKSQAEIVAAAKQAGATHLMLLELDAHILKNERGIYSVELHETIFDTVGNVLGSFSAKTGTKNLTVLEGALYDITYARDSRERLLN